MVIIAIVIKIILVLVIMNLIRYIELCEVTSIWTFKQYLMVSNTLLFNFNGTEYICDDEGNIAKLN